MTPPDDPSPDDSARAAPAAPPGGGGADAQGTPGDLLGLDRLAPDVCAVDDLSRPEARALAAALASGRVGYASLVECRRGEKVDLVIVDVEVELAQVRVHDIRHVERLGVLFVHASSNAGAPQVFALRPDFPADAPHVNLRLPGFPTNLCLYDVPFRDVRAQWTPSRFVALVREWLRLTARGELHADDQPLEPLLIEGVGWVILPAALRAPQSAASALAVRLTFCGRPDHAGKPVLVAAVAADGAHDGEQEDSRYVAAVVHARPRPHGVVRSSPETLADVHALLEPGGDDLLGVLRASLPQWALTDTLLKAKFLLVVLVPMQRVGQGAVESVEPWVLITDQTLAGLGRAVGAWDLHDGKVGALLAGAAVATQGGDDVRVEFARPYFGQTRDDAAQYNGRAAADERRIVAIGAGALGSQVMLNAARAALGRWTVIDDDVFLPHNLARHALGGHAVGFPKASYVKHVANSLVEGEPAHDAIDADVLEPGDRSARVAEVLGMADVIVDLSASVTVARALARDVNARARRLSLFLSPDGTHLTLLAEDTGRSTPLDALEMQHYRAVAQDAQLRGAFAAAEARHRYGRSCRDVTVPLPQSLIAVHSGIATMALAQTVDAPEARISVWRADPATGAVAAMHVAVRPVHSAALPNGWTLVTDDALLQRLAALRLARLPNETGGVLVGAVDFTRRITYVVDTVPSPTDSHEYPTSYWRGSVGLRNDVERIEAATAGQLHYVGEWHSHPVGYPCLPSTDDAKLFAWLAEALAPDGMPPLMMIVGDGGLAVPYLGALPNDDRYPAELRPGATAES